jgi:hypothetical protein
VTYRRPGWQTLVLTAAIATFASALLAFSRPLEVVVDGQRIASDVPPVQTSPDKIYVPLRSVADALGAETIVDEKGEKIAIVRGNQSLRLTVGDTHATLNGMPLTLHHAPFRVRGRVMVSLQTIARAMGVRAIYDARTARIDVLSPGVGDALNHPAPITQ